MVYKIILLYIIIILYICSRCVLFSHNTVIADAVVIIVLVFLDKPIPSWIYPFIFYIQVREIKKANHAHILNDWLMKICCFQLAPVMGLDFPDSFIKIGKYVSLFHCKIHTSKFFIFFVVIFSWKCIRILLYLRLLSLWQHELTNGIFSQISSAICGDNYLYPYHYWKVYNVYYTDLPSLYFSAFCVAGFNRF